MPEDDLPAVRWMRQWKAAGPALEELRRRELFGLTDAEALSASETLLSMAAAGRLPAHRRESSGLVEQQALFHRTRRR